MQSVNENQHKIPGLSQWLECLDKLGSCLQLPQAENISAKHLPAQLANCQFRVLTVVQLLS